MFWFLSKTKFSGIMPRKRTAVGVGCTVSMPKKQKRANPTESHLSQYSAEVKAFLASCPPDIFYLKTHSVFEEYVKKIRDVSRNLIQFHSTFQQTVVNLNHVMLETMKHVEGGFDVKTTMEYLSQLKGAVGKVNSCHITNIHAYAKHVDNLFDDTFIRLNENKRSTCLLVYDLYSSKNLLCDLQQKSAAKALADEGTHSVIASVPDARVECVPDARVAPGFDFGPDDTESLHFETSEFPVLDSPVSKTDGFDAPFFEFPYYLHKISDG